MTCDDLSKESCGEEMESCKYYYSILITHKKKIELYTLLMPNNILSVITIIQVSFSSNKSTVEGWYTLLGFLIVVAVQQEWYEGMNENYSFCCQMAWNGPFHSSYFVFEKLFPAFYLLTLFKPSPTAQQNSFYYLNIVRLLFHKIWFA